MRSSANNLRRTLFVGGLGGALLLAGMSYIGLRALAVARISELIESGVETTIGNGIDVEVEEVGGSIIRSLRVGKISTVRRARRGFVRSIQVSGAVVRYRLVDIAGIGFAFLLPRWPGRTEAYDVSWLKRSTVGLADVVANLGSTLPATLEVAADGVIEPAPPFTDGSLSFGIERTGGADELVSLTLSGLAGGRLELDAFAKPGSVSVQSSDARAALAAEGRELTRAEASVRRGTTALDFQADTRAATLSLTVAGEVPGTEEELSRVLLPLSPGKLSVSAEIEGAELSTGTLRSVVHELLLRPAQLLADSAGSATVAAAGWVVASATVSRADADVAWRDGLLTISRFAVEAKRGGAAIDIEASGTLAPDLDAAAAGSALQVPFSGNANATVMIANPGEAWGYLSDAGLLPARADGFHPGSRLAAEVAAVTDQGVPTARVNAEIEDAAVFGRPVDRLTLAGEVSPDGGTLESLSATSGDAELTAKGAASLGPDGAVSYEAVVDGANLEGLLSPISGARIEVRGTESRVELGALTLTAGLPAVRTVTLAAPTTIRWADESFSVSAFELRAESTLVSGRVSAEAGRIDGSIDISQLELAVPLAIVAPDLTDSARGTISMSAGIAGTTTLPEIRLEATSSNLRIAGQEADIAVSARQSEGSISVETFRIALPEIGRAEAIGVLPLAVGTNGIIRAEEAGSRLRATVDVLDPARFMPTAFEKLLRGASASANLTVDTSGVELEGSLGPVEPAALPTIAGIDPFTSIEVGMGVEDAEESMPVSLRVTGRSASGDRSHIVEVSGRLFEPSQSEWIRRLGDVEIEARGSASIPLAEIDHLLPGPTLFGGELAAEIGLSGTLSAPRADGTVRIREATLKPADGVPTIGGITGMIRLDNDGIVIDEIVAVSGGGDFSLSGELRRVEESIGGTVSLTGRGVLLARSRGLSARGDVAVSLELENGGARLTGRVDATSVDYTRPVQLFSFGTSAAAPTPDFELFQLEGAWARDVTLDVRLVADGTARVDNNLYNGALSADVTLGGTAAVPRPNGRIFGSGGTVFLPTTMLNVRQIEVLFPPGAAFRPEIFMEGRSSIRGYDMVVTADGTIPDVEVDIVSSPPLPTDEAIVLLATGQRPAELDFTSDASGTLTAVGTMLGRTLYAEVYQSLPDESRQFLERMDFRVQQSADGGVIGDVQVEYQLADGERWFLLLDKTGEEEFRAQLAWRLWVQ